MSKPLVTIPRSAKASLAKLPRILLKPDEAAAAMGLSPRALFSLTRKGAVPCIRLGKLVRYSPSALRRAFDGGEGSRDE